MYYGGNCNQNQVWCVNIWRVNASWAHRGVRLLWFPVRLILPSLRDTQAVCLLLWTTIQQKCQFGPLPRHSYRKGSGRITAHRRRLSCLRDRRLNLTTNAGGPAAHALSNLTRGNYDVAFVRPALPHCGSPLAQLRPICPAPHVLPLGRSSISTARLAAGK